MALATATITFDVADLLGVDFDTRRIKAWTTTNADNNRLIDTAANKVRMGDGVATVAADGTGSFSVWVPGPDGNPTSWQQTFWFDYPLPGGRGRETRSFGPYTITGSADLADLEAEQAIPPTYLSEVAGALSGYVDDAQDAATAAAASAATAHDISNIDTSDGVVSTLVADPDSDTAAALATSSAQTTRTLASSGFLRVLTEANTRVVKVMQCGTSLAFGSNSLNQMLVATLVERYGDAAVDGIAAGDLGGSYQVGGQGWEKQRYAGRRLVRMRGKSSSDDLTYTFVNNDDTFGVEYSKDTNGGSFEVYVNEVLKGTVNCNGAQSSNNKVSYTVTPGVQAIRLHPVVSGSTYAYLEWFGTWKANAVGIDGLDFTFGGSALEQIRPGKTQGADGGQAAAVTISGYAGLDALFDRPDIDVVICSYLVNDAGSTPTLADYQDSIDRAIAKTAAREAQLILVVEQAGHYAMPNDSSGKHQMYEDCKAYLIRMGREHNHVTTIDWDSLTRMDDDLAGYAARYYPFVTSLNVGAGTYSGDFIHPSQNALSIGSAGLHALLGLPAPVTPATPEAYARLRAQRNDTAIDHSAATVTGAGGVRKVFPRATTLARSLGEVNTKVPFYVSDDFTQTTGSLGVQADIDGASTVDRFGRYLRVTADKFVGAPGMVSGELLWCIAKVKGTGSIEANAGAIYTGSAAGPVPPGDGARAYLRIVSPDTPTWVVWQMRATGGTSPTQIISTPSALDIYEFSQVVATNPVFSRRPAAAWAGPGPAPIMVGDLTYSKVSVGQSYLELMTVDGVGTGTVRKTLLGPAVRPVTDTEGGSGSTLNVRKRNVGMYATGDSTMVLTSRLGDASNYGTITETGAGPYGGTGSLANHAGAHTYCFEPPLTAMALPGSGVDRRTLALRQPATTLPIIIYLQSASNGSNKVWWNPFTAAWVTSEFEIDATDIPTGTVMSFPIDIALQSTLGSTGGALGTTAYLLIQYKTGSSTNVYSTATLGKGSSALVLI